MYNSALSAFCVATLLISNLSLAQSTGYSSQSAHITPLIGPKCISIHKDGNLFTCREDRLGSSGVRYTTTVNINKDGTPILSDGSPYVRSRVGLDPKKTTVNNYVVGRTEGVKHSMRDGNSATYILRQKQTLYVSGQTTYTRSSYFRVSPPPVVVDVNSYSGRTYTWAWLDSKETLPNFAATYVNQGNETAQTISAAFLNGESCLSAAQSQDFIVRKTELGETVDSIIVGYDDIDPNPGSSTNFILRFGLPALSVT